MGWRVQSLRCRIYPARYKSLLLDQLANPLQWGRDSLTRESSPGLTTRTAHDSLTRDQNSSRLPFKAVATRIYPARHQSLRLDQLQDLSLRSTGVLTSCTLHPAPYTLRPTPYTLHPIPYILHPASCTLHPALYTLHPSTCTLYPAPGTLHPEP